MVRGSGAAGAHRMILAWEVGHVQSFTGSQFWDRADFPVSFVEWVSETGM